MEGEGVALVGWQPALAQPCSALALGVVEKGLKGDTRGGGVPRAGALPKARERHFPGGGRFACVQGPCSLPPL
jgi:hypothetical protein